MPLIIEIPGEEYYNEVTNKIIEGPPTVLTLEHSLISISKWEAIWHQAYMKETERHTDEQLYSYIQCMCIKGDASLENIYRMRKEQYQEIVNYIHDPMTATTIKKSNKTGPNDNFVTSELIYAWMVQYRIPAEYQKWHLNRLLTLIGVLDELNKDPKKRSEAELARDYKRINEINRRRFKTKG